MTAPALRTIPVDCPIRGCSELLPRCFTRDDFYGISGEFRFVRCRHCDHLDMNPRPTEASLSAYSRIPVVAAKPLAADERLPARHRFDAFAIHHNVVAAVTDWRPFRPSCPGVKEEISQDRFSQLRLAELFWPDDNSFRTSRAFVGHNRRSDT